MTRHRLGLALLVVMLAAGCTTRVGGAAVGAGQPPSAAVAVVLEPDQVCDALSADEAVALGLPDTGSRNDYAGAVSCEWTIMEFDTKIVIQPDVPVTESQAAADLIGVEIEDVTIDGRSLSRYEASENSLCIYTMPYRSEGRALVLVDYRTGGEDRPAGPHPCEFAERVARVVAPRLHSTDAVPPGARKDFTSTYTLSVGEQLRMDKDEVEDITYTELGDIEMLNGAALIQLGQDDDPTSDLCAGFSDRDWRTGVIHAELRQTMWLCLRTSGGDRGRLHLSGSGDPGIVSGFVEIEWTLWR